MPVEISATSTTTLTAGRVTVTVTDGQLSSVAIKGKEGERIPAPVIFLTTEAEVNDVIESANSLLQQLTMIRKEFEQMQAARDAARQSQEQVSEGVVNAK
jgi:hypothetical protein